MHEHNLKRILSLVQRTGDRAVIADQDFDEPFVLMSADSYEDLWERAQYEAPEETFPQGGDEAPSAIQPFVQEQSKNGFVEQKIEPQPEQKAPQNPKEQNNLTMGESSDILKPAVNESIPPVFKPKPVPRVGENPPEFLPEPL